MDGSGLSCQWFDYNPTLQRCRCYGAGTMVGDTEYEVNTTAYIMNKQCDSLERNQCDGCYTKIWYLYHLMIWDGIILASHYMA